MTLEIIKTVCICETFNLSLIYFPSIKGYEVQYSNQEEIIEEDGIYSTKKIGLKVFKKFLKELIVEVKP